MKTNKIRVVLGGCIAILGVWLWAITGVEHTLVYPTSAFLGFIGGVMAAHD